MKQLASQHDIEPGGDRAGYGWLILSIILFALVLLPAMVL